ncbi:hypothetical protein NL676_039374 [Syzygium grande]|nr:hypothetical protein NL676_039374 [Syzygium grande]
MAVVVGSFEASANPGAIAPSPSGPVPLRDSTHPHGVGREQVAGRLLRPGLTASGLGHTGSMTAENFGNAPDDLGYPGGKFFDALCLGRIIKAGVYIPEVEKLDRLKLAEIKHARIVMLPF